MLKLYKKQAANILYWETWQDEKTHTVHQGVLGDNGESETFQNSKKSREMIEKETIERRAGGYEEIEDLVGLIIQYQIEGRGTEDDLTNRDRVVDLMNECLGWSGLGHCDGGDIGSGTANISCLVVDPYIARDIIVTDLEKNGLLDLLHNYRSRFVMAASRLSLSPKRFLRFL